MAKQTARHTVLSATAPRDSKSGDFRAVIETPKGSRNKYRYNPDCDCFELATTLPEGMAFPFDFGFSPSTLGDDGDPVDVLVLMDAPVMPGCILRCHLIGVIEAREKERGKRWEQNDRLIAVASHARTHEGIKRLTHVPLKSNMAGTRRRFRIRFARPRSRGSFQVAVPGAFG
jgi:inorganic pyrophosphatase